MTCKKYENMIIDYLDENLEEREKRILEAHMEKCDKCKRLFERTKKRLDNLARGSSKIITPDGFMENLDYIYEEHKKKSTFKDKIVINRKYRLTFVVLSLCMVMGLSIVGANALKVLIHPLHSYGESKNDTLNNLVEAGYGEKINQSVISNGVKITLENVFGDELNTVITYTIEDLNGENIYEMPNYGQAKVIGPFQMDEEDKDYMEMLKEQDYDKYIEELQWPRKGGSYNINANERKTSVYMTFKPMSKEEGNISFTINELKVHDPKNKDREETLNGEWSFDFKIRKIPSKVYEIDETIKIDGNIIKFHEIEIAPTATVVDYTMEIINEEYEFSHLNEVYITYKHDGEYIKGVSDFWGGPMEHSEEDGRTIIEGQLKFESIYLQNPEKITLNVDGLYVYYNDFDKISLEDIKEYPHEVTYKGNTIVIKEMDIQEKETTIVIEDYKNKKDYSKIDVELCYYDDIGIYDIGELRHIYRNKENGEEVEVDYFINSVLEKELEGSKLEFVKDKYLYKIVRNDQIDIEEGLEEGYIDKERIEFVKPYGIDINGYYDVIEEKEKVKINLE